MPTQTATRRSPRLGRQAIDRRKSARVRLLGEIHGHRVGLDLPLVIRDISAGGFAVESSVCFPSQDRQVFEFESPFLNSTLTVSARAVRSTRAEIGSGFVTGFEFTVEQPSSSRADITSWIVALQASVDSRPARAESDRAERRRVPRLRLPERLRGEVLGSQTLPFIVKDVGAGGVQVEMQTPLEEGAKHYLRLDLTDDAAVTLGARVVHVREIVTSPGRRVFQCGLAFLHDSSCAGHAVNLLLDEISSSVSRL